MGKNYETLAQVKNVIVSTATILIKVLRTFLTELHFLSSTIFSSDQHISYKNLTYVLPECLVLTTDCRCSAGITNLVSTLLR
jgi:hypothetical protein